MENQIMRKPDKEKTSTKPKKQEYGKNLKMRKQEKNKEKII